MTNLNLDIYINKLQKNKTFSFIEDIKLQEVLYLFSAYVFLIYFGEIKNNKYCKESKEIKAHTIFIYLGSIIEAVLYNFVEIKLNDEKSRRKYLEIEQYIKIQKIETTNNLFICKLEKREINLNESINFHSLINGLKDKKLIDKKIIEKINSFRQKRNMIHIKVFLESNEYELIKSLENAFLDTKEIFDYIEHKLKGN